MCGATSYASAEEVEAFADRVDAGPSSSEYDPSTLPEYPGITTPADPVTAFGLEGTAEELHGMTQHVSAESEDVMP